MIWLHNLYQHAISIHVSSALYSLYWNTKLSSLASLTKTLGLYLLSLDRKQIYFFYGFTPEKLKWSWFIVLATTAFSRSVDHRVCDNLQKKKLKIWCFFEITCHIPVLLSCGTGQAGLPVVKCGGRTNLLWDRRPLRCTACFNLVPMVLSLPLSREFLLWRIKFVDL